MALAAGAAMGITPRSHRFIPIPVLLLTAACTSSPNQDRGEPPSITSVEPRVVAANVGFTLIIEGTNLGGPTSSEATAPTLTIFRSRDLEGRPVSGPSDSGKVPVTVVAGVERIEIPDAVFLDPAPAGIWSFRVTTSTGQEATFADAIALLPPPVVTGFGAHACCALPSAPPMGVDGRNLLVLDGREPGVYVDNDYPTWDPSYRRIDLEAASSGCIVVPFDRADARLCNHLDATLTPPDIKGSMLVHVTHPVPLEQAAAIPSAVFLDLPIANEWICPAFRVVDELPVEVQILGGWDPVAVEHGGLPEVTIDGVPATARVQACTMATQFIDACKSLWVTVPHGLASGMHEIAVVSTTGCRGSIPLQIAGRPVVSSVEPAVACSRSSTITVSGSEFYFPHVYVGDVEVPVAGEGPGGSNCPAPRESVQATLGAPAIEPGSHVVTVESATSPPLRSEGGPVLSVVSGPPLLGEPSPQYYYQGVETVVTVPFLAPVTSVTAVSLTDTLRTRTLALPFTQLEGAVEFTVPAGLAPASYFVEVTEGGLCTRSDSSSLLSAWDRYVLRASQFDEGSDFVYVVDDDPAKPTHPVIWQATGGNPGGAVSYGTSWYGAAWYFVLADQFIGWDLGVVRFDLRRTVGSPDVVAPDVVIYIGEEARLERSLPAPPGTDWARYEIRLDDPSGWTVHDSSGNRAATPADLRAIRGPFWIRGQYGSGAEVTWLDNMSIELRH